MDRGLLTSYRRVVGRWLGAIAVATTLLASVAMPAAAQGDRLTAHAEAMAAALQARAAALQAAGAALQAALGG